jgi:hypothetical protein
MSTFLQLAQKLRRQCISNNASGPDSVLNQTGLLEKVVEWVADSYQEIQIRYPNWRWMKSDFTLQTVAGTDAYAYGACVDTNTTTAISRFACWWLQDLQDPPKLHLTATGFSDQGWLTYLPYNQFRSYYKFGARQTEQKRPVHISIDDADRIVIGPKPDAIYTVSAQYQRGPQKLLADNDTPDMPDRFHDLIMYYAMERYGVNSIAAEKIAEANLHSHRLMQALEQSQLPEMVFGGPLA